MDKCLNPDCKSAKSAIFQNDFMLTRDQLPDWLTTPHTPEWWLERLNEAWAVTNGMADRPEIEILNQLIAATKYQDAGIAEDCSFEDECPHCTADMNAKYTKGEIARLIMEGVKYE